MSDEHSVAIVSFEGAVTREIKRVRERLKSVESLSTFQLKIIASGRINDGEVKLTYFVANEYGGGEVKGDSLNAVLDEYLRRNGWEKIHAAKAISYEKIPSENTDEIPF